MSQGAGGFNDPRVTFPRAIGGPLPVLVTRTVSGGGSVPAPSTSPKEMERLLGVRTGASTERVTWIGLDPPFSLPTENVAP